MTTKAHTLSEAITHGVGVERPFLCPVHADTRPSASVNVVKGVWYCYTCKAHGEVGGEAMAGEPDFTLLREYVDGVMAEPRIYPESWLNQFDAAGPGDYWASRFSPEACEHFRLGQTVEGTPCYPLRSPSGVVHGIVRRTGFDHGPKYLYPRVDIGDYLFNFDFETGDVLFLVEGAADAIACWEVGHQAFALYGTRVSARQRELIYAAAPEKIVTAFDQDDPGHDAARTIRSEFLRAVHGQWHPQLGDIADIAMSTRKKILDRLAYGQNQRVGSETCSSTPILSPALQQPNWPPIAPARS